MRKLRLGIWPGAVLLVVSTIFHLPFTQGTSSNTVAFLNTSLPSSLILPSSWNLRSWTQLSFRTCSSDGELLSQADTNGEYLRLNLHNGSLVFSWNVTNVSSSINLHGKYNTNKWVTVRFKFHLGEVVFSALQGRTILRESIIANSSVNQYLLRNSLNSAQLFVGRTINGCINQGPGVNFNLNGTIANQVVWNNCSLSSLPGCSLADLDGDDCATFPCLNGGTCKDGINSYTCECTHFFNGTNCGTDLRYLGCSIEPCLNSGTCSPIATNPSSNRPYRCSCANGYTGPDCELVIDECRSGPCENSGICNNFVGNGYQCNCTGTGYSGTNCNEDIDECENVNCGSGTCYNYPGSYSCQCPVGFYGDRCQDDINECVSSPCQNDGTCNNEIDQFSCTCATGFTGVRCEVNVDDCEGVTCQSENATCKDLVNNHQCVCKPGFTGTDPNCIEINECAANPCVSGQSSRCEDLVNKFECHCVAGFSGELCEIDINECAVSPCQNNATCVQGINSYTCQCLPGYTDKNCSTNIDDCLTDTCKNDGNCTDLVNGFRCDCVEGWTSPDCSVNYDDCSEDPCQNNATCNDYLNYYNCTCLTGFQGLTCSENINDCTPGLCSNGGQCNDLVNDYRCDCTSQWMGKTCDVVYNACVDLTPCQNGATCRTSEPERGYNCSCVLGFTGTTCSINIDDCLFNNCEPYQQCYDGINEFECRCPPGFEGAQCEIDIDECANSKCHNGSICINGTGDYTCDCQQRFINLTEYAGHKLEFHSGYKGQYCNEDINECDYFPCLNGGMCNNQIGKFQCLCPGDELITGFNCELLTTYCAVAAGDLGRPPCKNGGTCQSNKRDYTCNCAPGWTGEECEVDINECESTPCQYNGSCHDMVNGYNCTCIPGITGVNCEINIDDCEPEPCLHGSQCLDQINQYICNCSDTGFKGTNCEINIDDCIGNPCIHGGSCQDGIKNYTCDCYDGYNGVNCEFDIKECEAKPCKYGGTCLERSNKTLYEMNEPGFTNFNYSTAAGYECYCIPGITGPDCDVNIDECEPAPCLNSGSCIDEINSYTCNCAAGYTGTDCETDINECELYRPCVNNAVCNDLVADYSCDCRPYTTANGGYGGKNCSVRLVGCDSGSLCQQGSTCQPNYEEVIRRHDYTCNCLHGYTGRYCNISTTFTVRDNAFVKTRAPQRVNQVSFRFRTSLEEGILMSYQPAISQAGFLIVQIQDMKIKIEYHNQLSQVINSIAVNDAEWHDVQVTVDQNITVTLDSSLCHQVSDCTIMFPNVWSASSEVNLYFGYSELEVMSSRKAYIGCMEDVIVNDEVVVSTEPGYIFSGTQKGCPRTLQCGPYTCNRHGDCKDLWHTYRCDCFRPFLGTNCDAEYIPATFAKDNLASHATFTVPQNLNLTDFDMSFFVQTRQDSSVIMYIGNTDSSQLTFLSLEMIDGRLGGRYVFCNNKDSFSSQSFYKDGEKHFVNLSIKSGVFSLVVKDDVVNKTIGGYASCPLQASILYFGGKTPSLSVPGRRRRREVIDLSKITDFSAKPDYEGVLQDIEINESKFVFFSNTPTSQGILPISQSNLTEGAVSTRVVCDDQPCANSGTCTEVLFNDFKCDCPEGFIGKNCSALDFCEPTSCPAAARCQSRIDGFECLVEATFNGQQSLIRYEPDILSTTELNMLSLQLRSVSQYATIFYLRHGYKFLKLRLADGFVQLNYKLTDQISDNLNLPLRRVNDGNWYNVEVDFQSNKIWLRIKENETILDEANVAIQELDVTNMVNNGANILLGGTGVNTYARGWEQPFKGCLNNVRFGGVLLPFFSDDRFVNNTSREKFLAREIRSVSIGCPNGFDCSRWSSMCLHGARCENLWTSFKCDCRYGFDGDFCQDNINECPSLDCNSGKCVDGIGKATCQCPKGRAGDGCETDVNFCTNESCDNNGSCYELENDYGCNCSDHDWTGKSCNILKNSTCDQTPCKNAGICSSINLTDGSESFNCTCGVGYQGSTCEVIVDFCAVSPCENGGNCTIDLTEPNHYKCSCPLGFNGSKCENNIDDCSPDLCGVNGVCEDGDNNYFCNCTDGWRGRQCNDNIDECTEMTPCQHGICKDNPGSYKCNCTGTGYNGYNCDKEVDECNLETPPCQNGAGCENTEGGYICNCTLGYNGTDCDQPDCSVNQCINNSTCKISNNKWKCECPKYYFGNQCETAGPCTNCYNINTQECQQSNLLDDMTYNCSCNQGWKGDNCTEDIDECEGDNPCNNGGTCQNTNGSFICNCIPGFTDQTCSTDIDDCLDKPCLNAGTCTDRENSFTCECTAGYTGNTCDSDVDECLTKPCEHEQPCNNTVGSYHCDCGSDYLGDLCQFDNPCREVSCKNDGTCKVNITEDNKYEKYCHCVSGFIGALCEKADPSIQPVDDDVNIWVIIGPIIAAVIIIIIIAVVVFLVTARNKRATRGQYCPSQQETAGARVELGHVLKRPPQERLI